MNKLALDNFSKDIIRKKENIGLAVDMTCGNGNDTLFLSGVANEVYAFDIQYKAIENTRNLIEEHGKDNVCLFCTNFSDIDMYLEEVDVFMYNLGYLPKGDKSVFTTAECTISSLQKAIKFLNNEGIISIMAYPGHEEGKREYLALKDFLSSLDNKLYEVMEFDMINKTEPPVLFVLIKK